MKTLLLLEIEHEHPLPTELTVEDVATQRIYQFLFAKNCPAQVNIAPAKKGGVWQGLIEKDFVAIDQSCLTKLQAATSAESILKERNAGG